MSTTVRSDAAIYDAPDGRRYTEVAQHLHWITPPIVLAQVAVAWVMRLTWRFTHPAPPPGPEMPRWLHLVGVTNHWLMYLVLFAMPISGYVMSAMGKHGVQFWGLPLPSLPHVDAIAKLEALGHWTAQWALYARVLLHVAATAYHVAVRRDGLLQRMIPAQTHADPLP